ncbi:hypothetical protein A6U85_28755 [Agrobacterium sp. 13-626]|nr:hypothetical protein A6U85_28755 [Agrobacterium sp. 13-626]
MTDLAGANDCRKVDWDASQMRLSQVAVLAIRGAPVEKTEIAFHKVGCFVEIEARTVPREMAKCRLRKPLQPSLRQRRINCRTMRVLSGDETGAFHDRSSFLCGIGAIITVHTDSFWQ